MQRIIANLEDNLVETMRFFSEELSKVRTGRVTSKAVENTLVEVYGTKMTLKELATIRIPEPLQIFIELWDKNILRDVERALVSANLGVSPIACENGIRLNFPPLTSEDREALVRVVGEVAEKARLRVRKARQQARQQAEDLKDSEGEDFFFRLEKEIDKMVEGLVGEVEEMKKRKEGEIRG